MYVWVLSVDKTIQQLKSNYMSKTISTPNDLNICNQFNNRKMIMTPQIIKKKKIKLQLNNAIESIAVSHKFNLLFIAQQSCEPDELNISVFDLNTNEITQQYPTENWVSVILCIDGDFIYVSSARGVSKRELLTFKEVHHIHFVDEGESFTVLEMHKSGKALLVRSHEGIFKIRDFDSNLFEKVTQFSISDSEHHSNYLNATSIEFYHSDKRINLNDDYKLKVWDKNGKLVFAPETATFNVIHPLTKVPFIITGNKLGYIKLINLETLEEFDLDQQGRNRTKAFGVMDEKRVFVGFESGDLVFIELKYY